ncbi:hypothetical protein ACFWTE_05230 [Nocardiopsis sp. NPDC058631]|uniref:hypothetical protein n=1 Tax=Nocardiopsis sp. NPDC058631 TaxID=3346566 RepID=UPI003658864A
MSGHEVGVNAYDAYGAGSDAEAYASGFVGLGEDFNETLLAAKAACDHDPKVTGWSAYGEEQAEAMAKVANHGIALSENVQAGASEASSTDEQSSAEFLAGDGSLSRPLNVHR